MLFSYKSVAVMGAAMEAGQLCAVIAATFGVVAITITCFILFIKRLSGNVKSDANSAQNEYNIAIKNTEFNAKSIFCY